MSSVVWAGEAKNSSPPRTTVCRLARYPFEIVQTAGQVTMMHVCGEKHRNISPVRGVQGR